MPSIRPFPLHDLSGVSPSAACKPAAAAFFHTKTNGCCTGSTAGPQPIIMGHRNQKLHLRFVPFELYQFCPQSSGVYFSFLSLLVQRFVVRFLSPSRLYDNSTCYVLDSILLASQNQQQFLLVFIFCFHSAASANGNKPVLNPFKQ